MKRLTVKQDANAKYSLFAIPPSDTINAKVLAANVAETDTVPADAKCVLFSATGNFYCKINDTAAIPGADVTDGSGSELNPSGRIVAAADTISLIAPADCIVTLAYYS
jgi:hypothetical protein